MRGISQLCLRYAVVGGSGGCAQCATSKDAWLANTGGGFRRSNEAGNEMMLRRPVELKLSAGEAMVPWVRGCSEVP